MSTHHQHHLAREAAVAGLASFVATVLSLGVVLIAGTVIGVIGWSP